MFRIVNIENYCLIMRIKDVIFYSSKFKGFNLIEISKITASTTSTQNS